MLRGGFIDDLSSIYRRTIITMSNETGFGYSYGPFAGEGPSHFVYCYLSAFCEYLLVPKYDGYGNYWNSETLVDCKNKTWRGAFRYAMKNDVNYMRDHLEYPWFDDDGNGLPTYKRVNGISQNVLDFPVNDPPEGDHSALFRWLQHDINYDGKVNMKDVGIVAAACFTVPGDPKWNKMADVNEDWKVDTKDTALVSKDFGNTT